MQKLYITFLLICISILHPATARRKRPPPPQFYEKFKLNATDHEIYFQDVDYNTANGYKTYRLSKNDTHIFVNTTDQNFKSSKCVMPFKGLNDGFQVTLNSETIILWDLKINSFYVVGVTLLSIDPRDCSYKKLDVPADVIPDGHPPYKPQVLTYNKKENYFDIFYGGRQACMPCRFTNEGEKKDMGDNQIKNITSQIARPYLIRRYLEGNTNISYLLIYSYYDHNLLQTAVNKLDGNFNLVEQKFVDHFVDAAAISQRGIELCYKQEYQRDIQETEVYCDHYLTNLRRKKHIKLDIPRFEYVNGIAISVSRSGSLCVVVPHISYMNTGNKYSMSWFRYSRWDEYDNYTPSTQRQVDFDDENGYHLKKKTLKYIREQCE